MKKYNLALAFYQDAHVASRTLDKLRRQGFLQSGSIQCTSEGQIVIYNTKPPLFLFFILACLALASAWSILSDSFLASLLFYPLLITFLAGSAASFFLSRYSGVDTATLRRFETRVCRNETLLLVQVRPSDTRQVLNLLRQVESSHPLSFLLCSTTEDSPLPEKLPIEPQTLSDLQETAVQLAITLRHAGSKRTHGQPLLQQLHHSAQILATIRNNVADAEHIEQTLTLAAEWLLDNTHVIQNSIEEVQRNLPKKYYHELPKIASGPFENLPRAYVLATTLVDHTAAKLSKDTIIAFINSYQTIEPLSMGELWAIPLLLKLTLIENIQLLALHIQRRLREGEWACFWGNRLLNVARREPAKLTSYLQDIATFHPHPSPHFAEELLDHLFDEELILPPVRSWLEEACKVPVSEMIVLEQKNKTLEQTALSNAIVSLITLNSLPWHSVFENTSSVDAILSYDPVDIYYHMDFETRDAYRHAIEELARRSNTTEQEVAHRAVHLAQSGKDPITSHVGYYLYDKGRLQLEATLGYQPPFTIYLQRSITSRHNLFYFSMLCTLLAASALTLSLGLIHASSPWATFIFTLLALLPLSEMCVQILNFFVTQLIPPRLLPKMSCDGAIPPNCKTLIVIPILLTDTAAIHRHIQRLEIHYLANNDPALRFAIFGDLSDSDTPQRPEDEELLSYASREIQALEDKYGPGTFFLFSRSRVWSPGENCWIGHERKRGKLEALNRFLTRDPQSEEAAEDILHTGNGASLDAIRYVITLDADTQLPKDKAKQLIATLSHPLNAPCLTADGRLLRGYSLIQPRVITDFFSSKTSLFTCLFSDTIGVDPYTQTVSDVYQDLTQHGTYHGKGIYDVHAFQRLIDSRLPSEQILSHDLLEGGYVSVGFAGDITLFDTFPENYLLWSRRQHRWIRGDWQITQWLLPTVPNGTSQKETNPLSAFDRWKIFDNLRRSLLPISLFTLSLVGWIFSSQPWLWTILVTLTYLIPPFLTFTCELIKHPFRLLYTWKQTVKNFLRSLVNLALLPHQAYLSLDAIIRAIYRRLYSHHHLLEWNNGDLCSSLQYRHFLYQMTATSSSAFMILAAVIYLNPVALSAAIPLCFLWLLAPFFVVILNKHPPAGANFKLSSEQRHFLRQIARRTWRYFDDFMGPSTHWLPPDNYQTSLQIEVASRTSPTNIGLGMLTILSGYDFKYITGEELIVRLTNTIQTLDKLERYEGHLLNWYSTHTLSPLSPRYVSTVDSGNLLASLWTLEQAIYEHLTTPILPTSPLEGLRDTLDILITESKIDTSASLNLHQFQKILNTPTLDTLQSTHAIYTALSIFHGWKKEDSPKPPQHYWFEKIDQQLLAWQELIDRYFSWVEVLKKAPPLSSEGPHLQFSTWRDTILLPTSWLTMASHDWINTLQSLKNILDQEPPSPSLQNWFEELHASCTQASLAAQEHIKMAESLLHAIRTLSEGMNLHFLYDAPRKLFSIGYQVDQCQLDSSHYDLLASEARLTSFIAIARGNVPLEHWWALGRPYTSYHGMSILRSWGGTMFEYLMPLLFHHYEPDTLLGAACFNAVLCQIDYGKRRGIPWGISESAFSAIDAHKIYQYRSFGVPELGLKRGLEEDLIVSPYSTALALLVNPQASIKNFKQLNKKLYSLLNDYGYYEAIDFTRQSGPHGHRGIIIHAYMAHHQGMSLLAINNILNGNPIVRRFHSDPRVIGVEPLLYENIPLTPSLHKGYRKEARIARLGPLPTIPIMGVVDNPHSTTPKINLLSNGTLSLMVTNAGGGYSLWRDFSLTRWRADATIDHGGQHCYIQDLDSKICWSTNYSPTYHKTHKYSVCFKPDKVEIKRRDHAIETFTEIVVSPEDDVIVQLLTLANLSQQPRRLQLTSYCELALAPHLTDRSHPAFNKLFIETKALPEMNTLLAFRRLRSSEEKPLWIAHTIAIDQDPLPSLQYETDRCLFIGRGGSLQHPQALDRDLSNSQGYVLDPIFSLRHTLTILPGQRIQVSLITAISDQYDNLLTLVKKYRELSASHRAIEMAWTHSQLELRYLRIHQEEAQLFQKLASRLLYPHADLRPSAERLRRNRLGQSSLWSQGISGDLPILVVTIADIHEIELLKQLLIAHTFWRLRGLKVDLVILNEEASSYDKPLLSELQRLLQAYSHYSLLDKPGGIFLRSCDQMAEEELNLLLATSRVHLIAARGSLRQQLVSPLPITNPPPPRFLPNRHIPEDPSPPLPFLELPYFNGLGGFSPDGREYIIYLAPHTHTPAPWINVIANPLFGTLITESGNGTSWWGNSQTNRLTPWSNDPILNPISDAIYLRDEQQGSFWTPTPAPIRELDAYRIHHGNGYTLFEHNSHGIAQQLTVFVPNDDDGGLPLRIQHLHLHNYSSHNRILTITSYLEWVLGSDREDTQHHIITEWDAQSQAMFAYNRYHPDFGSCLAFACSLTPTTSYTADRTEFLGRNHSLATPAAMKRKGLSGNTGASLDPCCALQTSLEIEPNSHGDVTFILGYAQSPDHARQLILQCRATAFVTTALQQTKTWWDQLLSTLTIDVPDLSINFACNRWLLYQNLSCRFWGRTAFYQSSGAYGFRDQLQDSLALIYSAPQLTRSHILRAAAQQFVEGDVQHWWHPPANGGVRTRISDDLLWLPYAMAQYIRISGDHSILDEVVSFLQGPLLSDNQHEAYFVPTIAAESANLLEHCRRALLKGYTSGPHGLPLIGGGDWNDGMNRVGIHGKGESVWLAWFLIHVMHDFAELLTYTDQNDAAECWRQQAQRLAENIEKYGWDGQWYRRAYYDDGTPLGSQENPETFIDSLAQSWSIISGAGQHERSLTAMKAVKEHLISLPDRLVLLLKHPFDLSPQDPGYIKGYPPGVRENGGQYTHGSLWVPLAFARLGDGDQAVSLLRMMHPLSHTTNTDDLERYKVEPYVLAADIYALPGQIGRGGWTWYTGSSAWMYRIWIEEILGFKLRGNILTLKPILPTEWNGFTIQYRYHNTSYSIQVEKLPPESSSSTTLSLDDNLLTTPDILLVDDGTPHTIRLHLQR